MQIQQGRELFRRGQVLRARETFLVAVTEAPASMLLELARTFDTRYLSTLTTSDGQADPQRALSLYEEAVKHGSQEAGAEIDRLRREHPGLQ